MDKRSTQKDGPQEQDVRQTVIRLIRTLFSIPFFIFAIYVLYTHTWPEGSRHLPAVMIGGHLRLS